MKHLTLRHELFWDMNYDALDEQKHKVYIVQQVLNFGTLDEFRAILGFYGYQDIVDAVKQAGYFDPKTFAFVINYFQIDKNDMLCYTRKRLNQAHWS